MMIAEFFKDVDSSWKGAGSSKITLKLLGSMAIFLQSDYERGTKDADVLEVGDVTHDVKERLLKIAGKKSALCKRRGMYIDVVSGGLAFMPANLSFHAANKLNGLLNNFRIEIMGITDVVVSKLTRFSANDVGDIRSVVEFGLVEHNDLVTRFKLAIDQWVLDARVGQLPRIISNLHTVERDFFLTGESDIELPDWMER